jgi:hypothetical protein
MDEIIRQIHDARTYAVRFLAVQLCQQKAPKDVEQSLPETTNTCF